MFSYGVPPWGVSVSNFIDSKLDLLLWLRQIIIFENKFCGFPDLILLKAISVLS